MTDTPSLSLTCWIYLDTTEREGGMAYPLFTVGFYDPGGEWQAESDHSTREAAAERVHYLNGGRTFEVHP